MNYRFLFRAKRMDNGEWVEGFLMKMCNMWHIQDQENENLAYEVDPSTICQCTGLKDKNGRLIWENDIVKCHVREEYAPIKYGVYQSCFDLIHTGHCGFFVDWHEYLNFRKDLGYWIDMAKADVVGNIFDNPELLEVD